MAVQELILQFVREHQPVPLAKLVKEMPYAPATVYRTVTKLEQLKHIHRDEFKMLSIDNPNLEQWPTHEKLSKFEYVEGFPLLDYFIHNQDDLTDIRNLIVHTFDERHLSLLINLQICLAMVREQSHLARKFKGTPVGNPSFEEIKKIIEDM